MPRKARVFAALTRIPRRVAISDEAPPVDVMHQQRLTLIGRHVAQRVAHFVRVPQRPRRIVHGLVRPDIGGHRRLEAQAARRGAAVHEIHVARDREHPGRDGPAGLVGAARAVHLQEGFLREIVGERRIAAQRQLKPADARRQRPVQRVERLDPALQVRLHVAAQLQFGGFGSAARRDLCVARHVGYLIGAVFRGGLKNGVLTTVAGTR